MLKVKLLALNIQVFAHKKGQGSTKNGRDSISKRLGAKAADGEFVTGIKPKGLPVTNLSWVKNTNSNIGIDIAFLNFHRKELIYTPKG